MPSTLPGKGALAVTYSNQNLFSGTPDPVLTIGYNEDNYGLPILRGENGLEWNIEGDYNDGSPDHKMEAYIQYVSADGTTAFRPIFFQMDRTTDALTNTLILGNPLNIQGADGTSTALIYPGTMLISPVAGSNTTLNVQASAGNTSDLQLGYGGVNNQLTIAPFSTAAAITLGSQVPLRLYNAPMGAPGSAIAVGVSDSSAAGVFAVGGSSPTVKGMVVRGTSGQTGNLQEWQNASATALDAIDPNGNLGLGTATPNSTLQVAGSRAVQVNTVSANYTLGDSDYYVGVSGQSGPVTLTLPSAAGRTGRVYVIQDAGGTAATNPITLQAQPGQTINGAGTATIHANYGQITVISNGSNWIIS